MVRAVQYFFILLGFGTLLIPIAAKNGLVSIPKMPVNENRKLASNPKGNFIDHINNLDAYVAKLDARYRDSFAGRGLAIRTKNALYYHLFKETQEITVGPEDWLFYPDAQKDLTKTSQIWDKAKSGIFPVLKSFQESLAKQGIYFIFYMAPHKQSIYPEFFPLKQPSSRWRDEFKSGAEEYGLNYVDAFELLQQAKNDFSHPLYHRTDWHWNSVGAAVIGKALIEKISHDLNSDIKWLNPIKGSSKLYSGPQAWALATITEVQENAWSEDWAFKSCVTQKGTDFIDNGSCQHKRFPPIIMIGDSFHDNLVQTDFTSYFDSVKRIHRSEKAKRINEVPGNAKIILFEAIEMHFVLLFNQDLFWSQVANKVDLSKN